MFRQSPRRNVRNKGLKIKHTLQVSVLLGVSIWLLYQVHHSNDKKAISVETNINEKPRNDSSKDMFKLGRKDLRPKVMEMTIKDSKEAEEHHIDEQGEQKEDGGSKKVATKEGNKRNEMENKKESLTARGKESKNKDQGKQKEVKELHKQIEDIKVKVNENKSNEQKKAVVMDNIERKDKS
nr:dentin sialophosphoprotein-like [Tanacetum cinerariifolium]